MAVRSSWVGAAAASLALGAGVGVGSLPSPEPWRLSFLSVGQGDCAVVRAGPKTILVDVGPESASFDAGARIVAPKLRQAGVEAIDLVVLTHPDADHIGGLSGLARRVPIRQVAVPAWFRRHPDLLAELKEARISTQRVLWLSGDWKLAGPGFTLEIRLPKRMTDDSDNEGSPFLRVHLKGMAAVLTGDAGEETELTMMGRADWRAAILKAGHHGSAGSSGEAWLRRVSPQVVVVSCGAGNRFGHPAPAAMERFVRVGASVLRTDRDGDVHFEPWGEGYRRVLD